MIHPEYTTFIDNMDKSWAQNEIGLSSMQSTTDMMMCIHFLYPSHILSNNTMTAKRSFLSALNSTVDEFNSNIMLAHPSISRTYYSADTMMEAHQDDEQYISENISTNILSSINHTGVPPHQLEMKEGTLCSLQCNLSVKHRLVENACVEIMTL